MPNVTKPVPIDESSDVVHDDTTGGTDGNPHALSAELDDTGVLRAGQVPDLAITNTFTVTAESDLTTLDVEEGDVGIVTDQSQAYILTTSDPTTLANWSVIQTPPAPVDDVFGRTGSIDPQSGDYSAAEIADFASTALSSIDGATITPAQTGTTSSPTDVEAASVNADNVDTGLLNGADVSAAADGEKLESDGNGNLQFSAINGVEEVSTFGNLPAIDPPQLAYVADEQEYYHSEPQTGTPFDITSASFDTSINSQDSSPTGIAFNDDGTRLFEVGSGSDQIYQSIVSTGGWEEF